MSAIDRWTLPIFLFTLLVPEERPEDWRSCFEENRVQFYIGTAIYFAWAVGIQMISLGTPLWHAHRLYQFAGIAVFLFAAHKPTRIKDRVCLFSLYVISLIQALFRLYAGALIQ